MHFAFGINSRNYYVGCGVDGGGIDQGNAFPAFFPKYSSSILRLAAQSYLSSPRNHAKTWCILSCEEWLEKFQQGFKSPCPYIGLLISNVSTQIRASYFTLVQIWGKKGNRMASAGGDRIRHASLSPDPPSPIASPSRSLLTLPYAHFAHPYPSWHSCWHTCSCGWQESWQHAQEDFSFHASIPAACYSAHC